MYYYLINHFSFVIKYYNLIQ